jgi:sugar phosphate isomerase/epimerase
MTRSARSLGNDPGLSKTDYERKAMSKLTRREWNKVALGGLAAAALPSGVPGAKRKKIETRVKGVLFGAQSYSFRDRPLDELISGMVACGLGTCELWQVHLEPKELYPKIWSGDKEAREQLRQWRLSTPLSFFREVRNKFDRAGVDLYAYNYSMTDDFTDPEIERGFEMARALGAKVLTSSSNVTTTKRIDQFAKRYKMKVGLHNHSDVEKRNEISNADSIRRALEGTSSYIAINLDIGHFAAANDDAVGFLKANHERIVTLHIKDRKRDQGPNVPFGTGDAPIKEVLVLLRDNKWPIPANLEYEYEGQDTIAEVKRCLEYCKAALNA